MEDLKKAENGINGIKSAMSLYEKTRVELKEFREAVVYLDSDRCGNHGVTNYQIQPSAAEEGVIYSGRNYLLWNAKVEIPGDVIEDLIRKRHAELEKEFAESSAIIDVFSRALKI